MTPAALRAHRLTCRVCNERPFNLCAEAARPTMGGFAVLAEALAAEQRTDSKRTA